MAITSENLLPQSGKGFLAGVLATIPMTFWMLFANQVIRKPNSDTLPPEEITNNLLKKAKVDQELNTPQKKKVSLINHFLYGGLVAIPFGVVCNSKRQCSPSAGISYGLLVWAGNYLGLLPSLDLYPPATREPKRMNGIMIAAHVIWGAALGQVLPLQHES